MTHIAKLTHTYVSKFAKRNLKVAHLSVFSDILKVAFTSKKNLILLSPYL